MKTRQKSSNSYKSLQNQFRGIVSNYRSKKFVKGVSAKRTLECRRNIKKLYLDARVLLEVHQYEKLLRWTESQMTNQLQDLKKDPIGYEDLSGMVSEKYPIDLVHELIWVTERIRGVSGIINEYIAEKNAAEKLLLEDDYENAIKAITRIENMVGISVWSVQLKISIENMVGGLERQKLYVAEVRNVFKRGLLSFIAYYTGVRNEEKTTFYRYCEDVKARIKNHPYYGKEVSAFLNFSLLRDCPSTSEGMADVLFVAQNHALIDIYESTISVLQEVAKSGAFGDLKITVLDCLDRMKAVNDFRIVKLRSAFGSTSELAGLASRNTKISDAVFSGDSKTGYKLGGVRRVSDPWATIYHGIATSELMKREDNSSIDIKHISRAIGRIIAKQGGEDSYLGLLKLSYNLSGLPYFMAINDFLKILRRNRVDTIWAPAVVGMNCSTVGVEDFNLRLSSEDVVTMLQDCNIATTVTVNTWLKYYGEDSKCTSIAESMFRSAYLLNGNRNDEALEILESLEIDSSNATEYFSSIFKLQSYTGRGDKLGTIELIVKNSISEIHRDYALPIIDAIGGYQWRDYSTSENLLLAPIALHLLWIENELDSTASILRFATRHSIRVLCQGYPSRLYEKRNMFDAKQLVYFLRFVCVPSILDVSSVLKGTRAVVEERQAICATLRMLDPVNSDFYQSEIMAITNMLAMEEGKRIVDRTRIHVDVDALSRWAKREMQEDYLRYKDLLSVNVEAEQNFDDVLKELFSDSPVQRSLFVLDSEADAVLLSILNRLSEEFLHNPNFGFDYFLSKRIRHQSFIGLIRGPLEFSNLITTRSSESGDYRTNEFWLIKFEATSLEKKQILNRAFMDFAKRFDEALNEAKNFKFHINSKEKPRGLLSFDFSVAQFSVLKSVIKKEYEVDDFIHICISAIWAGLEKSLAETRKYISEELKSEIAKAFDEFRAVVRRNSENDPAFLEFDVEIGKASVDVQHALDDVSMWFSGTVDVEAHKKLFQLDQALRISIESALRCQMSFHPIISETVEGSIFLDVSSLVFIHDVLFIALDNVRAHSNVESPKIDVIVKYIETDQTLSIRVESDLRVQKGIEIENNMESIRNIIEKGNVGVRTKREGGSGFLKLAAVVKQSDKGKIDFGIDVNGRFFLTVTYSIISRSLEIEVA